MSLGFTPIPASQILIDIQDVFIAVFGVTCNVSPTGGQGVFIQELANMAVSVQQDLTLLYDGLYNPNVATGIWLDSICSWNSITRLAATPSVVTCQVTGLPGTVIPINSQILNSNGDIFYNQAPITIGAGGTGSGTFYSLVSAPIQCNASSLTRIVQQVAGWDTVTNALPGILGLKEQTDNSLRNTRLYELGIQGTNTDNAVIAGLYELTDVVNVGYVDNRSNSPITKFGVTVDPHSVYISVYGGTQQEIAGVIFDKLSAGCGMNGNTTVSYIDPQYPWVVQNITYQTPEPTAIEVDITFVDFPGSPSDATIQNAIVANFLGQDPNVAIPAVQMGVPIYASRFYATLNSLSIYQITLLTIEVLTSPPAEEIDLPISEVATLAAVNVVITRI